MRHSPAAQRAARRFWGVVASGLLVVSGITVFWLFSNRAGVPMTILEACLMMMRQVWGLAPQHGTLPPVPAYLALGLVVSGLWAGAQSVAAWWHTRRLLTHSEPYRPGCWPTLDAALATLPYGERRLRVLATAHPTACTVGLWRPQLVLSAGLIATLSRAELGAAVGHERGHASRRDPLRLAILRFWSATLWFFPIVRALAHDSARAMEDAADDVAVRLTDRPLDLAAALVKTAQAQVRLRWAPVPALGGEPMVTERVERLLAMAPARPPQRHYQAWAISAVVATCLLGLLMLLSHSAVATASTPRLVSQPPMMTCPMPVPQGL